MASKPSSLLCNIFATQEKELVLIVALFLKSHPETTSSGELREDFKKKNVEFGLLAEIRRGRGLRGIQEPNLLSGNFFIV